MKARVSLSQIPPKAKLFWQEKLSGEKRDKILSETPFKKLVFLAILLNICVIVSVLLLQKTLPPEVPLYYGMAEGEKQIAPAKALVIPPIVSLAIATVNIGLSSFNQDAFIKKTLTIGFFLATFFSTIAIIKVILLVGGF